MAMTTTIPSENLIKAAEHYEEAARHLREAARLDHDHQGDHLVRLGAAHAAHALQHVDEAAKEHATGLTEGCCCN